MNKYERFLHELKTTGSAKMKVFGQSMKPKIKSGSTLTYEVSETYEVGDVVCCKVKSKIIDAHLVTQVDGTGRYMISNNHGHQNGWTRQIYAKVVKIEPPQPAD